MMLRQRAPYMLLLLLCLILLLSVSVALQLELPDPTGPYAVGRTVFHWTDASRPEIVTDAPDDVREVIVNLWYPAEPLTGTPVPYFPDLNRVGQALQASGEVSTFESIGLPLVRGNSAQDATPAATRGAFPVILLLPGNATNVEFYAALADDLASHGYVVAGLNHPYDVAAVALNDGHIASYTDGPVQDMQARAAHVQAREDVRAADARFALDQLAALNAESDGLLAGRLDMEHVGIMGHSLGGLAAAQVCTQDARFKACANFDGLQAGGAFSAHPNPDLPTQPFLFITKETTLLPDFIAQFESLASESYVVTLRGAAHNSFTDGPLLTPSLLPTPSDADRFQTQIRAYTRAFFDHTLNGESNPLLSGASSSEQLAVTVYAPS